MTTRILRGHVLDRLAELPDESVHCCVSSPPYFGLRSYGTEPQVWDGELNCDHQWGHECIAKSGRNDSGASPSSGVGFHGQAEDYGGDRTASQGSFCRRCNAWRGSLGLEPSPELYIAHLVEVFREVRRVLRKDGTLWLNIGDSYGSGEVGRHDNKSFAYRAKDIGQRQQRARPAWSKPKDLLGIPWMLAFALRADGWWLRSEIVWCLSGGAWAYARTQKGEMPVMIKDLVRLDPRTVKLWNGQKWTQVVAWGQASDAEERIEIVLRSGERIGCTGGHVWPTDRGNIPARSLREGLVIQSCVLPEPNDATWPQYLSEGALWLVGLYLAEGSRSNNCLRFTLCADELPWAERIKRIAEHYGGSSAHSIRDGTLIVSVWGRVVRAIVESFIGGVAAIDKHLKVAAWRLNNEALKALIVGYLDGDAHHERDNNRWRLGFCRNYALERDLRTAAARLGATITLKPGTATYQGGDLPSFRGEWRWERSGHWNEKHRGEIMEIRASRARQFWDIAVEDEPHLFALASGVLTHNSKKAPMPESVTDRPTCAHEKVFLLTKSPRYFYDAEAVKEMADGAHTHGANATSVPGRNDQGCNLGRVWGGGKRNMRNWWLLGPEPFPEAHFATFPTEIPRICIKAGTSERGVCPKCGAPWERVTSRKASGSVIGKTEGTDSALRNDKEKWAGRIGECESETIGWHPTCSCDADPPSPATVLDPFLGAGTTALVADQLGRDCIGIELNTEYAQMAERRLRDDAGMFAQVGE